MLMVMAISHGLISLNTTDTSGGGQKITDAVGNFSASYSWIYPYDSNSVWTINVTIPEPLFAEYKNQARTTDYSSYVTANDEVVDRIAQELKNDSVTSGYDTAQFVLSFVQNIPYGTDENTTNDVDYPRYPVETLVDDVGDCKDHSTLFASLLKAPVIDDSVVLLELLPTQGAVGHMAVGVEGTEYSGSYVRYDGGNYFYSETTSNGWLIGEMPSDLSSYSIHVLPT
ncbi:MAG: hypothetical protein SA339_11715 [Methanomassiliicoccus sp.]|nr:hypothetical protein [Methanomassiliicoccus sp.]